MLCSDGCPKRPQMQVGIKHSAKALNESVFQFVWQFDFNINFGMSLFTSMFCERNSHVNIR